MYFTSSVSLCRHAEVLEQVVISVASSVSDNCDSLMCSIHHGVYLPAPISKEFVRLVLLGVSIVAPYTLEHHTAEEQLY